MRQGSGYCTKPIQERGHGTMKKFFTEKIDGVRDNIRTLAKVGMRVTFIYL